MPGTVHVTIYPAQIQLNFERSAGKDAEKVGAGAVVGAQERVGKRTGYLASTITFGRQPVGKLLYRIRINAGARYAQWVEQGTTGPITPKRGRWLRLPAGGGYGPKVLRSVRGQRAQHFLRDGTNASLIRHGYGPIP